MTQEEIEKQSEEYVAKYYKEPNSVMSIDEITEVMVKQAHKDGAKWGMEHAIEWHDLRKDPTDLPKEDCTEVMFITKGEMETLTGKYKNGGGEGTPIFDTLGIAFYGVEQVIAWCELPQFKE